MVKICIVTPYVLKGDGQGRANYEIVWEALRRGHHVTLLARKVAPNLQQHPHLTWISFPIPSYPLELLKEATFSRQSSRWLKQHRSQFNLVQVYGCVTEAPSDINTVQFVHHGWLHSPVHTFRQRRDGYGFYHWIYTRLNAFWEKHAFSKAQTIIAVSESVAKELVTIGVPSQKIKIIFNGVDLEEFAPSSAQRHQWQLPSDVPLALFVGDLCTNRKNLETVLYALKQVPELHLAVVGNLEGSSYPQLVEQLQLSSQVHFLGYRPDVARIMQIVDFFVFPTRYEPFGMVILEAMASGLPVITTATAGAAEIMTSKCGVTLSDSEDISALKTALNKLSHDSLLRQKMGEAGRAIAQHHSWRSKAQSYVDLFEEMAISC